MNRKIDLTKPIVVCVLAMISCFLWGSAFPCIKIGYALFEIPSTEVSTVILFAGIRFTAAGLLVIVIGSLLQGKPLVPKKNSIGIIIKVCLFQTILQYLFFYIGVANTSGVKASIIEGSNVFVAILIAALLFRQEIITSRKMIGCLIGFAGVIIINLTQDGIDINMSLLGEGFVFISTFAYAISSVLLKRYSKQENPVVISGYQFVMGGIVMSIIGVLTGGRLSVVTTQGVVMLFYLACISAIAYSLWGLLLKYNPVSKVAVYGFMNPVFGVILSAVFLNEAHLISAVQTIVSLILVCIGIYVVNAVKE